MTVEISPDEYARLIRHSADYVRRYLMKGKDPDAKLVIRVRTNDVLEDIYDIETKEDDQQWR